MFTINDEGLGVGLGEPVTISISDPNINATIEHETITHKQVAEVTIIPGIEDSNKNLTVNLIAERNGVRKTKILTLIVREGVDTPWETPVDIRNYFLPLLTNNYSEFGITTETEWVGTIVKPHILVVMYYLFFSDEWEMGVCWHVTIYPHDWVRIYLRHRFTDVKPSYAFEVSSWSQPDDPFEVDLKIDFAEDVWC